MSDFNKVYPILKTICYTTSSVFLYYLAAIAVLACCWRQINARLKVFATIVLLIGFLNFALVQIICYIDFLVDYGRCQWYTRLTTILGDLQHLAFDLYQMRKILPLLGSILKNPKPIFGVSWFFFAVRIAFYVLRSCVQKITISPPLGGFTAPGIGICGNTIDQFALLSIRLGSFAFEIVLFVELVYILLTLRKDSRISIEDSSRLSTASSIERLLNVELFIFVIYFFMDATFLIVLIIPNGVLQYGIISTLFNAVLPTIIVANILCGMWYVKQHMKNSQYPQSLESERFLRSNAQQPVSSSATDQNSGNLGLNIEIDMFKTKKEFQYSTYLLIIRTFESQIVGGNRTGNDAGDPYVLSNITIESDKSQSTTGN